MRTLALLLLALLIAAPASADLLIPMDSAQQNHLKAYGLAFKVLKRGQTLSWLLNYRGGSFLIPTNSYAEVEARMMGVSVERVSAADVAEIRRRMEGSNMDEVLLEVPPRIAIYAPPNFQPWDDAVSLALEYAEIDFETIFDAEVLAGGLSAYDWVHLHHEDFTGQYGKFYFNFGRTAWYQEQQQLFEELAAALGYPTVRALKGAVALSIKEYVVGGGFLFAMCSATDTFDIALAGLGVDFAPAIFDGTPVAPGFQELLDFGNCVAFEDFRIEPDPAVYEYSDIDTSNYARLRGAEADYFTLFEFSARARSGADDAHPVAPGGGQRASSARRPDSSAASSRITSSSWPRSRAPTRSSTSTEQSDGAPLPSTAATIPRTTRTRLATRRPIWICIPTVPDTGSSSTTCCSRRHGRNRRRPDRALTTRRMRAAESPGSAGCDAVAAPRSPGGGERIGRRSRPVSACDHGSTV